MQDSTSTPLHSSPLHDLSTTGVGELYAVVGLLVLFSVVGVAGNAIVLYVFGSRRDQRVSTVFIVVLAGVDFTTCLVVIPFTVYVEIVKFNVGIDLVCKLYQFLITSNIPFSALIMVAIAIDRYLCICHPFAEALNQRRAWVVASFLAVFVAGIGVCVSLMYGVEHFELVRDATVDVRQNGTAEAAPFGGGRSSNNESGSEFTTVAMSSGNIASDRKARCRFVANYNTSAELSSKIAGNRSSGGLVGNVSSYFRCDVDNDALRSTLPTDFATSTGSWVSLNRGVCYPTQDIISEEFLFYFQKAYNGMFLVCFIVVVILYILIYRSVIRRRTLRLRQKSYVLVAVASGVCCRDDGPSITVNQAPSFRKTSDGMSCAVVQKEAAGAAAVVAAPTADQDPPGPEFGRLPTNFAAALRRTAQSPASSRSTTPAPLNLVPASGSSPPQFGRPASTNVPALPPNQSTPSHHGSPTLESSFVFSEDAVDSPPPQFGRLLSPDTAAVARTRPSSLSIQSSTFGSSTQQLRPQLSRSRLAQSTHVASLKTAAMLFVVTVVFVVTYLPAFLMSMQLVEYRMFVFYMYFANNIANPLIYSFMNQNFRDHLRRLFCVSSQRRAVLIK